MNYFESAVQISKTEKQFITATLISIKGSAPQNLGAKMIVSKKGLEYGTIGGGKIEAHSIEFSLSIIQDNQSGPIIKTWNLQKDIGMTCGGEVTLLFETFNQELWPIVIFGAGHVAQALTRTLLNLNCFITCVDNRKDWLERLPKKVNAVYQKNISDYVDSVNPSSFFVCMTQGHSTDVPVLEKLAKTIQNPNYIGVIGSKQKSNSIKKELKKLNVSEDFLNHLRIPIGLDIGNNDPHEIAISITAELLQVRDLKSSNHQ